MEVHEYAIKGSDKNLVTIEVPFEEYKELLIIKGKYEELKSQKINTYEYSIPHIKDLTDINKIYCKDEKNIPSYKVTWTNDDALTPKAGEVTY